MKKINREHFYLLVHTPQKQWTDDIKLHIICQVPSPIDTLEIKKILTMRRRILTQLSEGFCKMERERELLETAK